MTQSAQRNAFDVSVAQLPGKPTPTPGCWRWKALGVDTIAVPAPGARTQGSLLQLSRHHGFGTQTGMSAPGTRPVVKPAPVDPGHSNRGKVQLRSTRGTRTVAALIRELKTARSEHENQHPALDPGVGPPAPDPVMSWVLSWVRPREAYPVWDPGSAKRAVAGLRRSATRSYRRPKSLVAVFSPSSAASRSHTRRSFSRRSSRSVY